MVRVISVHHFVGQHVRTIEQPTACTTAPPDKLLLALTNNSIEVHNLNNNNDDDTMDSDVLFTFPTVDEVIQIIYSRNGDYIGTLETKFNRQNKEINFVRIYINWNNIVTLQQSKMTTSGVSLNRSECGMVQPMRARIAGRVTPTTNQSELTNLEMIEIPIGTNNSNDNPQQIQCCPISGNLLILNAKNVLIFYQFCVKTHDISKLKFIDFEQLSITIQLPFQPNQIEMNENYLGVMNRENMYVFKIINNENHHNNNNYNNNNNNKDNFEYCNETVDYQQLLDDDRLNQHTTINLPTIKRDNSLIHKQNPFMYCDKEICATIINNNNNNNNSNKNYEIVNLIQLKLVPIIVESLHRQITEEFKCFTLKPLYIDDNLINYIHNNNNNNDHCLISDYRRSLNGIVCMLATQQEGYLYYFDEIHNTSDNNDNCIGIYPFTSPIQQFVMEDYFLHALTETGLESYTLRYGHKLFKNFELCDNINVTCPSIDDPICLIGLRPFLGIERLLLNDHHLILLANNNSNNNSDISPTHSIGSNSSSNATYWTLYNLELPNAKTIYNDISIVANVHRFTSIQTYCHLLSEAHIVLRLSLLLKQWTNIDDNVRLIIPKQQNCDDLIELYRTSCALLGDHYIMCHNEDDYKLAIPYYKMARISPIQVVRRVRKIQEQSNNHSMKGLMNYLKHILIDMRNVRDIDRFFGNQSKQNFIETILDIIDMNDLPELIIKCCILREYSIDKLINLLTTTKLNCNINLWNLSLTILYLQKSNKQKSLEYLEQIPIDCLLELLLDNWELLFDITQNYQNRSKIMLNFSEFSCLLMDKYPKEFSQILIDLIIEKSTINLNKLIRIFLDYIPTSIGHDNSLHISQLLQETLELYFNNYIKKYGDDINKLMYERGVNDAIKLLIRSYLSQLQLLQIKDDHQQQLNINERDDNDNDDGCDDKTTYFSDDHVSTITTYLFENYRYAYLDKMPPFQVEITSKLYEICVENYTKKDNYRSCNSNNNNNGDFVLKKLQAILCSPIVSKQILNEVETFLTLNDNLRGNLSLRSILLNINDAIVLLIDTCPQCLLQFAKDRFQRTDDWKFLIATIQRRILRLSQNDNLKRICLFHMKILKDILTYAATTMLLEQLIQIFPQRFNISTTNDDQLIIDNDLDLLNEIQNYEPYILICKETMHANQINKLITTTGQQLLCTLNL